MKGYLPRMRRSGRADVFEAQSKIVIEQDFGDLPQAAGMLLEIFVVGQVRHGSA